MVDRVVKIAEINEEGISSRIVSKDEFDSLKGKIIILNPDESEIAKNLSIKEKGVFGIKFR